MPCIACLVLFSCLLNLRGMPLAAAGDHVQATMQPDAKTVLFFGDSLTAGYGLDPAQAFPALIQAKSTAHGWNFQVINAGLNGETTAGGLRRIDWVLQRPIAVLVLALGANDGLRGLPLAEAKRNLQAIIDRTRRIYPEVKIVIAGMQVPTNLGREYTTGFRTMFPALAAANAATLMPFLLEGVGGIPALNLPDGIHPNPAGHKIIAENVWQVLEPVLQSLQAP
jgi:acyl-CoA thioesterase-1